MKFYKNCCNSFKAHKTNIKQNVQVISVKFAKDLQKNQFAIILGKKCGNCNSRLNKLCDGALSFSADTDFTRHSTDDEEIICAGQISNSQLNTSLSEFLKEFGTRVNCIFSEHFASGL